MLHSLITRIASTAVICCGLLPSPVQAGPLIDWLFGHHRAQPAYAVGMPVPVAGANGYATAYGAYPAAAVPLAAAPTGYAANYGTYYGANMPVIGPAGAGYQAQMPSGIAATTMPGAVPAVVSPTMSYVPNFNSYANRAPVTYYRPLLTTDPNTGAQVVAMAPCTSYEYQTQRVAGFGRRALFGSAAPPIAPPAPQALPTYTLPSGGIPLASSAPSVMAPTVLGYGTYSAMQPAPGSTAVPGGAYPTAPSAASPYYGAPSGGSCGNYQVPNMAVPGLVAPPAVSGPSYSPPGATSPSYPGPPAGYPSAPGGVYPPTGLPSSDPAANTPPTLPPAFPTSSGAQSNLRPQLRSIVRQPIGGSSDNLQGSSSSSSSALQPQQEETPSLMTPIPVPRGFNEKPRWNPGLLHEDDLTAMHPVTSAPSGQVAGESKAIRWASFEQELHVSSKPEVDLTLAPSATSRPSVELNRSELSAESSRPRRFREIQSPSAAPTRSTAPASNSNRYDNSGWESVR